MREKTLPLIALIERDTEVAAAMRADAELARIAAAYRARMEQAASTCAISAACYTAAERLTPEDVSRIETALRKLAADNAAVRRFADEALKASGIAATHDAESGPERLAAAWRSAAQMMEAMVSVYGENGPTRFAAIDSMRPDPKSDGFGRMMRTLTALMLEQHDGREAVFEAPADFALSLMQIDGRDEAGRHEPMEKGENRIAYERMKRIDWNAYPYVAIIVPGVGPSVDGVRLDPAGRLRVRLALERFRTGKAPFLIVSGGYVHPARTPYSEAIEMKRALMNDYGVPEEAILVDPHARHTTTNLRNSVRLMFHYGAPMDRKLLVVSDEGQIGSIAADAFDTRNKTETGIVPYRSKKRLSTFEVEIEPSRDALEPNPQDPLDP